MKVYLEFLTSHLYAISQGSSLFQICRNSTLIFERILYKNICWTGSQINCFLTFQTHLIQERIIVKKIQFKFKMSKDKESICVTVRVRPLSSKQSEEDSRVCLKVDEPANLISLNGDKEAKDFYFDSVCDRISQNEFFERVGRKSTDYCMEGYNCTIFAYGQTGAGKTFTMMGVNPESRDYHDLRGLIPRTLQYLFESIEKQINELGVEYMIKCSFIEIYNEQIIDLRGSSSTLSIREDLKKGVYIEGVTEEMISRSDEALQILRKGSKGRHVGSTCYNENSSRSHSVFTMQIDSQKMNNGIKSTKSRHFHFIDLAGSEKTKKINGDRLKEGCSINKSLHVLSTVIGSLGEVSEGKTRHINYRDSKLTFLLKDSLGGNSKTHVIANISPSWTSALETRSTLIFARKVKMIKMNKVSINEDSSGNLQSLKAEIKRLKSQNIFLRNGGTSINNSLQVAGNTAPNNHVNSKMMGVLQQYVDEELDKQTQMQLELAKMKNKNSYLQKGIKHFSENQKQLRMVIAIYEDKIKRLKETEEKLLKQVQENKADEKFMLLKDYFEHERKSLLQEVEKLKKVSSSTGLVKNLLRDLKIVKEENQEKADDEAMIKILCRNNQFLQEIKQSIKQLEPEAQEGKASALVLKENEEIKTQNQELTETVEKRNIQIIEIKDKLEQAETLLEESIATQISLEKKLAQETQQREALEENMQIEKEKYEKTLNESREEMRALVSKQNQLEMVISENNIQMSEMKKALTVLKDKHHFEQIASKEKIESLEEEKNHLEEVVREKIQQIQKLRNEAIQFKSSVEKVQGDLMNQIEDYHKKISEYEAKYSHSQFEKTQLKNKIQANKEKHMAKLTEKDAQIVELNQKLLHLKEQIRSLNQDLARQHKNTNNWKEACESQEQQFANQKMKWEQHNKEMLAMINEKEMNDSETHQKLTQSQLELMEANQKVTDLKNQIIKAQGSLVNKEKQFKEKALELEEEICSKTEQQKILQIEIGDLKKKYRQVQEQLNSNHRKMERVQEELEEKQITENKVIQELQKSKEKEKQLRINFNDLKNEIYAIKKNHEVEIESYRDAIKRKDDQIAAQERQHIRIKQNLQKSLGQTKQIMENQIQVLKQNQESIKKALEAHLKNKQTKIAELKHFLEDNEEKLVDREAKLRQIQEDYEHSLRKISQLQQERASLTDTLGKVEEKIKQLEDQLNETQNDHIRVLEDNQNNFNEEMDAKNAEIQKLQKILETKQVQIEQLKEVNEENLRIKEEIEEVYSQIEIVRQQKQEIQGKLEEEKQIYLQSDHQCSHLEAKLVERDNKITELETEVANKKLQVESSQNESQRQITLLIEQKQKLGEKLIAKQAIEQELRKEISDNIDSLYLKQTQVTEMSESIGQFLAKIQTLENDLKQLHEIKKDLIEEKDKIQKELLQTKEKQDRLSEELYRMTKSFEGSDQIPQKGQQPEQTVKCAFERFKRQIETLNKQIDHWRLENSQLKQNQNQIIGNLKEVMVEKQKDLRGLTEKINEYISTISNLEGKLESLENKMNEKEEEVENLRSQMAAIQESKSQQIANLNYIYEKLRQEKESLKKHSEKEQELIHNAKVGLQTKIEQLQHSLEHHTEVNRRNQAHLTVQKERNQELQQYVQEQNTRLVHTSKQRQHLKKVIQEMNLKLQETSHQGEKYKLNMEHQTKALKEELSAITQEATEWKNTMQQLEKDLKMANQRSQKYRKEFYRQRDSNREFKQLLDNAHCQIDSFKAQAQDKDRLYHQLLDKVSRNDVERKGLLTQDRKISELLEKSRVEVNEYRKKYDDQLKINNLLKQQIEKKQLDNAIMKQKSEDYVKKNQSLIDSIRADYTLLEENYKKKESQCTELKKTLHSASQKISQLEEHYQQVLEQCRNAQRQNEEIKRQCLRNGSDDKQLMYINKVKEQNKILRKQLEMSEEQLNREKSELVRLKSQKRYGREPSGDVSVSEYNKKQMEVKYLQKQIDDLSMLFGNIELSNKKSVGEGIRTGIIQLQRELAKTKNENMELKQELHSKSQKINIIQSHKYRTFKELKDDDGSIPKFRSKISKTNSTLEEMRKMKEDDKSILQTKDPNKNNSSQWNYNR